MAASATRKPVWLTGIPVVEFPLYFQFSEHESSTSAVPLTFEGANLVTWTLQDGETVSF
jgi:hypothetical protein